MSRSQVAKEGFDFDDRNLGSLTDFSEASREHNTEKAGRRGDAVGIGMILTFQFFVVSASAGWCGGDPARRYYSLRAYIRRANLGR